MEHRVGYRDWMRRRMADLPNETVDELIDELWTILLSAPPEEPDIKQYVYQHPSEKVM